MTGANNPDKFSQFVDSMVTLYRSGGEVPKIYVPGLCHSNMYNGMSIFLGQRIFTVPENEWFDVGPYVFSLKGTWWPVVHFYLHGAFQVHNASFIGVFSDGSFNKERLLALWLLREVRDELFIKLEHVWSEWPEDIATVRRFIEDPVSALVASEMEK